MELEEKDDRPWSHRPWSHIITVTVTGTSVTLTVTSLYDDH